MTRRKERKRGSVNILIGEKMNSPISNGIGEYCEKLLVTLAELVAILLLNVDKNL